MADGIRVEQAYQDLAQVLRQLILDGRIPLAAALPSERELAVALGVSRTTVTAAYTILRDEGFVVTQRGARGKTALPGGVITAQLPFPVGTTEGGLLDLAYATLPAPEGALHQAYTAAVEALTAYLPTHGYSAVGLPVLRERVAEHYTERGLPTAAEQIIITFGAVHAFGLLMQVFTSPGDRILVDHPTYPRALDTIRQAACRTVPVALTDHGWDIDALRAAIRQTAPRLAYLIPDFHNPTGWTMSEPHRAAVAHAAFEGRVTVVVDETLSELALDVPVPAPFALFGGKAEVITIGSLSKAYWGGLRIGWIRAPRPLVSRIMTSRSALDLGTPLLEQLAAATLLADREPLLTARRELLRRQRKVLQERLKERLPGWRWRVPEGGLSLWVTMPRPVSSLLTATAERFGLRLAAGARFGAEGLFERQLRLPFTLAEADIGEAVERLAQAYTSLEGHPNRAMTERAIEDPVI